MMEHCSNCNFARGKIRARLFGTPMICHRIDYEAVKKDTQLVRLPYIKPRPALEERADEQACGPEARYIRHWWW